MVCSYRFWIRVLPLVLIGHLLSASPSQYFAQLYTEILGRSPTTTEWVANEYRFRDGTFSATSARELAVSLFQSSEFAQLGYSHAEQAYLLFRATLLREPSLADQQGVYNQLVNGVTAATIANNIMRSVEYSNLVSSRISAASNHAFVPSGPVERVNIRSGGLGNISEVELQNLLNATPAGSTIFLTQGSLIYLHQGLIVPSGVTLATFDGGAEDSIFRNTRAYAKMARIVRANVFNQELIRLEPGAKLIGVWVDGRRSQLRVDDPLLKMPELSAAERASAAANISIWGGTNGENTSEVSHCRISDSSGWTSIHCLGSNGSVEPGYTIVNQNLITSYSASRDLEQGFYTDGVSNAASDAVIINNEIIDPSDVGVVIFNPGLVTPQRSQVISNKILFAGVNGWGGITIDHIVESQTLCKGLNPNGPYDCQDMGIDAITADFTGTLVQDNLIWSSDTAHTNVGVSVGVHMWGIRMFGKGSQVLQNRFGTSQQPLNAGVGIAIAGMKQPIVLDNVLNLELLPSAVSCLSAPLVLDPTKTTLNPGAAIQPGFTTAELWGTLNPRSNGHISGLYRFLQATQTDQGVVVETPTTSLKIANLNGQVTTDEWTIVRSGRQFGDSIGYHLLVNRGTHQHIQATEAGIGISPFTGASNQYWKIESYDGATLGNGLRLINRETGAVLGHDAIGNIFAVESKADPTASWLFSRVDKRPLDFDQSELLFMDPYGDIFQIYTDKGSIYEERSLGNANADFGIRAFADDATHSKPIGTFDANGDGSTDIAYIMSDGSIFVTYMNADGYSTGGIIGNPRSTWFWDINPTWGSWEKPMGFANFGGSAIEDLLVVDRDGNLEVGYINNGSLGATEELGSAAALGLQGLNSTRDSALKSVGSGDFDGDGDREFLIVATDGALFRLDVTGGQLQPAVPLGNPVATYGWGFTSLGESPIKPVGIADVNGDRMDDVVMVTPQGDLFAYIMGNGQLLGGANLGNPSRSWFWNLSSISNYSRPVSISYGKKWWSW